MQGKELKKRWDRFLLSEGFQQAKVFGKKQFMLESDFSQIYLNLDYAPAMRFYSPECTIILCELGIRSIDMTDKSVSSPIWYCKCRCGEEYINYTHPV